MAGDTNVGFGGVLIAVGFEGRLANIAIALAFLAALTYALNSVMARYISSEDSPLDGNFLFHAGSFCRGLHYLSDSPSNGQWAGGGTPLFGFSASGLGPTRPN